MHNHSGQLHGIPVHNMGITICSLPQLWFVLVGMVTTLAFISRLYNFSAQFCTHILTGFNSMMNRFITTMHSPNKDHNKGE
jgi:hypothetical protein